MSTLIFITSHLSFEYYGIYYSNTISDHITGILLATYKSTLSQQALSHMSPMAFKIELNAVPKVGCTSTFDPKTLFGGLQPITLYIQIYLDW